MRSSLVLLALLFSVVGKAQDTIPNWRADFNLGSARQESNHISIGFSKYLGTSNEGYTNHYISYDFALRYVDGVTTSDGTSLDVAVHQLSWATESGCLNNICADSAIGLFYTKVDEDLFTDETVFGYFIRVGGSFKLARSPKARSWVSNTSILVHMNAWFGFDDTTTSDVNVYNGFFPTVGTRINF